MKHHIKFVSIKHILNRLLKDEPYINEINLGDAVEWAGNCLNRLGSNSLFSFTICTVAISECKGLLPTNFKDIEAIRESTTGVALAETHNKFPIGKTSNTEIQNELEYDIKGNVIFVEFAEGEIEILYKGYLLDDDGFPKIPDEQRVIDFIYWNIAYSIAYGQWGVGKMTDKLYNHIHQKKLWHGAAARLKLKMPGKRQMQSIVNQSMKLTPDQYLYQNNFVSLRNINRLKIT